MQLSKNYVLRTIAGDNLLVPLGGSSTETKGMILLNELSLFVYESIQKGQTEDEILSHILDELMNMMLMSLRQRLIWAKLSPSSRNWA